MAKKEKVYTKSDNPFSTQRGEHTYTRGQSTYDEEQAYLTRPGSRIAHYNQLQKMYRGGKPADVNLPVEKKKKKVQGPGSRVLRDE